MEYRNDAPLVEASYGFDGIEKNRRKVGNSIIFGGRKEYEAKKAYAPSVLGHAREVMEPSEDLILQAIRQHDAVGQSEQRTARVYGGGGPRVRVDDLYVVMGDTVVCQGRECRVLRVEERYNVSCGVAVARVRVLVAETKEIDECYVVPSGVMLRDYRLKEPGHLVLSPGTSVQTKAAITCFSLDVSQPLMGSWGCLSYISYGIRVRAYKAKRYLCCRGDNRVVVRLDDRVIDYLHKERLGALSSITSEQSFRILYSSAVKKFGASCTADTIKATCRYFATLSGAGVGYDMLEASLIERKTTAPSVFDPRVAIIDTGGGILLSERDMTRITVVDNGLLKVKQSNGAKFEGGILEFTTPFDKPRDIYHVGPAVASAAVRYTTASTHNKSKALIRMTNSRIGEAFYRVNADLVLFEIMSVEQPRPNKTRLQPHYLAYAKEFGAFAAWGMSFKDVRKFRRELSGKRLARMQLMQFFFAGISTALYENMDAEEFHFANALSREVAMPIVAAEPHIKREERMKTIEKLNNCPRLYEPSTWPTYVDGKVKWENGKFNKLSRQYISMFNGCALEWLKLPELFKHAMAHPIDIDGVVLEFIPDPSQGRMDSWAQVLASGLDPNNSDTYGWYHSDDSIFSLQIEIGGERVRLASCIDIAKCDLSHSPALFVLLAGIMEKKGFAKEPLTSLFLQLKKDVRITHPNRDVDEYVIFELASVLLFSGSVLTTLVNNMASLLLLGYIIVGLLDPDKPYGTIEDVKSDIIRLAKEVGYEVTIDALVVFKTGVELANLTFLKHFPALAEDGSWVAVKDYATLVRGIGFAEEQVDGSKRLTEIFRGWNCSHHNPLLDQVFETLGITWPDVPRKTISLDSFVERYQTTPQELLEGFELLTTIKRPVFLVHPAFDAILRVGYGLPRLFEEEPRLPTPPNEEVEKYYTIDNG